jgi:hypothetical protein
MQARLVVYVAMEVPQKMLSGMNLKYHNQRGPTTIEHAMEQEQQPSVESGRSPTGE